MNYPEMLHKAADILEQGWCVQYRGLHPHGYYIDPIDETCEKRCLLGGIDYALYHSGLTDYGTTAHGSTLEWDMQPEYLEVTERFIAQENLPVRESNVSWQFARLQAMADWNNNLPEDTGGTVVVAALRKLAENWEAAE